MINRNSKAAIGIEGLFEAALLYTAILNIISRQWKDLAEVCLVIICITLPFILTIVANKKKIVLPSSFQLMSVLFIGFSLYFGEIREFYQVLWWWDSFLHGVFGIYAVILGIHLAKGIIKKDKDITNMRFATFIVIFAFCFSMTLGVIWEIFEFLADFFLKTDMLENGIEDTMSDLMINGTGALTTSLIFYHRKLKKQKY